MRAACRIVVCGARGRMGQAILRLAGETDDIRVIGAIEDPQATRTRATVTSGSNTVSLVRSLDELGGLSGAVLVDFSAPEATRLHAPRAAELGMRILVGTTGLAGDDRAMLAGLTEQTAVLLASNMSVGVNLLLDLVGRAAAVLRDYDLEVVEIHHNQKKDAPSGTALSLAESAAKARGIDLSTTRCDGRSGLTGARPAGQIGIHAVRGGDVVGEHTVMFAGAGERVEFVHRAQSRDTFAAGALRAARFLAARERGMFTMSDVLDAS